MKYFLAATPAVGTAPLPARKATVQRHATPAGYGQYTITYDLSSGKNPAITCSNASCQNDLLPQ